MTMAASCSVCELHAESTFRIEGMDCREEVAMIERRFKNLPGLEHFSADVLGQRLHVKYDAARLSTSSISAAVADAGMRAWLEHEEPIATGSDTSRLRTVLLSISGVTLAGGLAAAMAHASPTLQAVFLAASIAAGVPLTARKAWHAVRLRSLDVNVLMLVAAAGAIALGQWSEAASVVFLFAVAQALETRTLERARTAVRALMGLTPTEALVVDGATERRVAVDAIAPGMVVVVKPGEKVPLDGQVVSGASAVNQAPVTGESLPIDKMPGDELFAGSINGRGALEMRVTRVRRDTTLARIIHLVEEAQAQRAPSQTVVERFARIYTPAVIALAVAIAVVPPLVFGAAWSDWIYRSLVLLVVSCPCALVISTPVSIVAALAGAARKGVLIKGGAHLERASEIRCVAFDKTGTLTRGTPEVVEVVALGPESLSTVIALAAAIERRSEHPVAEAVVRHAKESRATVLAATEVLALTGLGAEGRVGGSRVVLGNHRLFEERRLCSPDVHARLDDISARGRTPVLVARDGRAIGIIAVADRPREASGDVIELLRRQGIVSLVMLTGDSHATAKAVAAELGVDEFRAELMPEDKVAAVHDLRRRFGAVAMVGDGVNDAPALASADLGIVMGAAGSDAALETADIALMADELLRVPYALRLSRATMKNIKVNLAISLVLKAAFVVAAVAGVATLWMAIVADTGASVIVVANALRLLRAD
ncbi:MAG: heavy metal translocating P-type ATPase [Luteitalea sp.]|nr:heavy metal translocating P-type ATPase [Luteitalea sp.]